MKKYVNFILFLISLIFYFSLLFLGMKTSNEAFFNEVVYDYSKYGLSLLFIYAGVRLLFLYEKKYDFSKSCSDIIILILALAFGGCLCMDGYILFSDPLTSIIAILGFPVMILLGLITGLTYCFFPAVVFLIAKYLNDSDKSFRIIFGLFMFVCAVIVLLLDGSELATIFYH